MGGGRVTQPVDSWRWRPRPRPRRAHRHPGRVPRPWPTGGGGRRPFRARRRWGGGRTSGEGRRGVRARQRPPRSVKARRAAAVVGALRGACGVVAPGAGAKGQCARDFFGRAHAGAPALLPSPSPCSPASPATADEPASCPAPPRRRRGWRRPRRCARQARRGRSLCEWARVRRASESEASVWGVSPARGAGRERERPCEKKGGDKV